MPAGALHYGIPARMARAVHAAFERQGREPSHVAVLDALLADCDRIPLATETGAPTGMPAILNAADQASRECYAICQRVQTVDAIQIAIGMQCRRRGVPLPIGETIGEIIARACDKAWWRRVLRTEYMRRFEHTAIQIGLTHIKTDPYVSRETAIMQETQNRANQKLLEGRIATNEAGQSYSVAELAALGTGNKTIRRGELMLRIRGLEEIAQDMHHVAMFWTITAPSKFHSVGGTNKKYNGATPREAQAYLVKVWSLIRSAMKREGMQPYGFRIAEPHSDGCPHWHMLFFVAPAQAARMEAIIAAYALEMDGDEAGAKENRIKLVRIEAGKGSAAGYIAKYVSKNIDGAGVGDHKTFEDGRTYIVAPDIFGDLEITASKRVTYWSQVWGIRQFQQIGGAPVGVWRELRRVKAETVQAAPPAIKAAHAACQKIGGDNPLTAKQASFAAYVMAQGGPTVGRGAAIKIASKEVTIIGRYATYDAPKPVGVYLVAQANAVYESVRYTWTIAQAGAALDLPRTGVNNCTPWPDRPKGGPAWTRPATAGEAPKPEKKFSDEDFVGNLAGFAKANAGDGKGEGGWSLTGDMSKRDRYQAHRKGSAELMRRAHLDKLREDHA